MRNSLLSRSSSSSLNPARCLAAASFSTLKITSRYRRTSGSLQTWRCTTVHWQNSSVSIATSQRPSTLSFQSTYPPLSSPNPPSQRNPHHQVLSIHQPEGVVGASILQTGALLAVVRATLTPTCQCVYRRFRNTFTYLLESWLQCSLALTVNELFIMPARHIQWWIQSSQREGWSLFCQAHFYFREGGYVLPGVCLFVCLSVCLFVC